MFLLIVGMGLAGSIWAVGVVGALLAAQCDAPAPQSHPAIDREGSAAMQRADRRGTGTDSVPTGRATLVPGPTEPPTWLDSLRRLLGRFRPRPGASTRLVAPTEGRLRSRPSGGGRYRADASHRV